MIAKKFVENSFDHAGVLCEEAVNFISQYIRTNYSTYQAIKLMKIYVDLLSIEEKKSQGVVYTPFKMEDFQVESLAKYFTQYLKRPVTFKAIIDEKLLTGVRVVVNDVVWDNSLKGRLESLSACLSY